MRLPEGYSIKDEPYFVFLHCGKEEVAVFTATGATEKEIEKAAWRHAVDKLIRITEEEK